MRNQKGTGVKVIGNETLLLREIADLRRTQKALNVSELRYRRLFETAKDGILILDAETGKIMDVNPFLIEMLGCLKEQLIGENIWEIGSFKDIMANRDNFLELQQKEYIRYDDLPLRRADGRQVEVEFVSNSYTVDKQKLIQCNIREIADRKQTEKVLSRDRAIAESQAVQLKTQLKENKENRKRTEKLVAANKMLAFQNEGILYLSYHDQLTGLYNRRFYEEELMRLDIERNLPISIVMGDVNGLKLINDSFGHVMGDNLLKKVAELLKKGCRADEIIARFGGDEFIILLPETDAFETEKIIKRIKDLISKEKIGPFDISISFGFETKKNMKENMQDIFKNTEDHMYRHKLSESTSIRNKTVGLILNTLFEKSNREKTHSKRVSDICVDIATRINFDLDDINQIRTVGLMHDIGKIGIDEEILNKPKKLNSAERKEIERHSEIGYQILSSVNDFSEIAVFVLEHHEKWNGKGYLKGLKGEEISLQARIIAVADAYDAMTSDRTYKKTLSEAEAIDEIRRFSGTQFAPDIAKVFVEKVLGKEW